MFFVDKGFSFRNFLVDVFTALVFTAWFWLRPEQNLVHEVGSASELVPEGLCRRTLGCPLRHIPENRMSSAASRQPLRC